MRAPPGPTTQAIPERAATVPNFVPLPIPTYLPFPIQCDMDCDVALPEPRNIT
jgi:hypothetical protein